MKKKKRKPTRLIISEIDEGDVTQRTTHARSELYRLIAQFRKDAETTKDPNTRMIFEVATELMSGLALAFQSYENYSDQDKDDPHT